MFNSVAVSTKWKNSSRRTFWAFYSRWNSKNSGDTEFSKFLIQFPKKR